MVNHSVDVDFHINMIVALVIVITIILALIWFFILNENDRKDLKDIAIRGINNTFAYENLEEQISILPSLDCIVHDREQCIQL